jgi:hypothetical protein
LPDLSEADALHLAAGLSRRLRCRTALLAVAAGGGARAWLHDAGALRASVDFDPDRGDAARALAEVPAEFSATMHGTARSAEVLEHPATRAQRRAQAAELVERMREQVRSEVASNAAWLRRHAEALGLEPPTGDELDRGVELELMRHAHARLREAAATSDPRLERAREEILALRSAQERAFFDLASKHAQLLGIAPPPASSGTAPYFATVEHLVFGGSSQPPYGARPFVEELAMRLGLDVAWHLTPPGELVPLLAELPR